MDGGHFFFFMFIYPFRFRLGEIDEGREGAIGQCLHSFRGMWGTLQHQRYDYD